MAAPPELNDDAIAEVLLHLPPEDPACLVRAAVVCKPWRRILCDPAFPRRYREFHRTPPLLGFLRNRYERDYSAQYVPTAEASAFSPAFDCYQLWTLDCRHGRVLFRCLQSPGLLVWDPITGGEHCMPEPEHPFSDYAAAVLCAVDGCDHLDCHGGPFLLVVVGADPYEYVTRACVYSSEVRAWRDTDAYLDFPCPIKNTQCLLARDVLYFIGDLFLGLVKYDLGKEDLSVINTPEQYHGWVDAIILAEEGGLGLAGMEDYRLHLWSWQPDADGTDDWAHKIIDLKALLAVDALSFSPGLIGYAEGSNTIFMDTSAGAFALELI